MIARLLVLISLALALLACSSVPPAIGTEAVQVPPQERPTLLRLDDDSGQPVPVTEISRTYVASP